MQLGARFPLSHSEGERGNHRQISSKPKLVGREQVPQVLIVSDTILVGLGRSPDVAGCPELEANLLIFSARPDSGLEESHLRTFSDGCAWRAIQGPEREVFFAQDRNPGQLLH